MGSKEQYKEQAVRTENGENIKRSSFEIRLPYMLSNNKNHARALVRRVEGCLGSGAEGLKHRSEIYAL